MHRGARGGINASQESYVVSHEHVSDEMSRTGEKIGIFFRLERAGRTGDRIQKCRNVNRQVISGPGLGVGTGPVRTGQPGSVGPDVMCPVSLSPLSPAA